MFIKRIIEAFKTAQEETRRARVARILFDDPLSLEMIRSIAKEFDYHFEIVRRDGTIMRFRKREGADNRNEDREVW